MYRVFDITSRRYGRAVVLRHVGRNRQKLALWECRCDCGTIFTTTGQSLRTGDTRSCGCLYREKAADFHKHREPRQRVWFSHAAYMRAYREKNRETLLVKNRAWRESHREELRAAQRRYRERHLNKRREQDREYQRLRRAKQRAAREDERRGP